MDNNGKLNNVITMQLHCIKNYTLTVSPLTRYNVYNTIYRTFAGAGLDLNIEHIPKPVAKPARHLVIQMQILIIIIIHFLRNWFLIRSINTEKFALA